MQLIPYHKRCYDTRLRPEEIRKKIVASVLKPDTNFTFGKAASYKIFEGTAFEKTFIVSFGRYILTVGKTSISTLMYGKVENQPGQTSKVYIVLRLRLSVMAFLSMLYSVCFICIYLSVGKVNLSGIIVPSLLIVTTYCNILFEFNQKKRKYIEFIEGKILGVGLWEEIRIA
ncbi:MAG: hypothetical protein V4722_10930 [Bacteroidota bacterium]